MRGLITSSFCLAKDKVDEVMLETKNTPANNGVAAVPKVSGWERKPIVGAADVILYSFRAVSTEMPIMRPSENAVIPSAIHPFSDLHLGLLFGSFGCCG
mmetsp:Transcript_23517/g.36262  ORF Transcript_23517/g.36262 Transcript_23517/m.36262 type:complete len:99 (+) Transcript_23517:878-1174(+)